MSTEDRDDAGPAEGADFAAAVDAHRRELRAHCRRFVGDSATADDLVQETVVHAWQARETFEGRSTLRTWLYRIATNVCIDAIRRDRHRATLVDLDALYAGDPVGGVASQSSLGDPLATTRGDSEPESAVVSREALEVTLLAAVKYLPPRQRAVFVLRDGLGWSARETAQAIDCTTAATNSALQRARATLRRRTASAPELRQDDEPTRGELDVLALCVRVLQHGAGARTKSRIVGQLLLR